MTSATVNPPPATKSVASERSSSLQVPARARVLLALAAATAPVPTNSARIVAPVHARPDLMSHSGGPCARALVIRMYYEDHQPPRFHASYGGDEAVIRVDTLEPVAGTLPRRALAMVLEWASLHRPELQANWARAARLERLEPIPPLD